MLSKTKYAALCVLGTEIFYVLCLIYGLSLSARASELHHSLFELMPLFVWGSIISFVLGALYLALFSLLFGWYVAWMHNASLVGGAT